MKFLDQIQLLCLPPLNSLQFHTEKLYSCRFFQVGLCFNHLGQRQNYRRYKLITVDFCTFEFLCVRQF